MQLKQFLMHAQPWAYDKIYVQIINDTINRLDVLAASTITIARSMSTNNLIGTCNKVSAFYQWQQQNLKISWHS